MVKLKARVPHLGYQEEQHCRQNLDGFALEVALLASMPNMEHEARCNHWQYQHKDEHPQLPRPGAVQFVEGYRVLEELEGRQAAGIQRANQSGKDPSHVINGQLLRVEPSHTEERDAVEEDRISIVQPRVIKSEPLSVFPALAENRTDSTHKVRVD